MVAAAGLTPETYAGAIERLAAADPMLAAVVELEALLTLDDARLRAIGFSWQKPRAARLGAGPHETGTHLNWVSRR